MKRIAIAVCLLLIGCTPARKERPTIVLISIDTLRADHLGAYSYPRGTSPFLDSLAKSGTQFDEAVVPLPSTGPSHASLLTGCSPWRHGLGVNGIGLATAAETLPMVLRRAGYYTAGAVAVTHLGAACGFARGFDSFSEPDYRIRMNDNRRSSENINAAAQAAVDRYLAQKNSRPLFLFVHYYDCHFPYRWWDASDPDRAIASSPAEMANRPKQLARYDSGIRHVDDAIRQLHTYLESKGLLKNAVFVITSDHGEQIGDHGTDAGHMDIYRETVRVPLIIQGNGFLRRRVKETVSSMDVAPTLARIGGATFSTGTDGNDLQPAIERAGLASWVHEIPRRRFVVVGVPDLTHSVELIEGSRWFIKNFDPLYRDAWIMNPAPATGRPLSEVKESEREDDRVLYRLPSREYRPHFVTLEHVAASPQCTATALLKMLPVARYFNQPIQFKGSIRLIVPASRLDSVALLVSPVSCAGRTFYSVARPDDARIPHVPPTMTDLYRNLHTLRSSRSGDELYDVRSDPAMIHPIPDRSEVAKRDRELARSFREVATFEPANLTVPLEQQRRLRALGYVQ